MEFRQLEYFAALSKYESFTRTAEMLHVSQPSVTKGIKALEAELGVLLIDRRIKHVTLTPQGKALLVHAEKIIRAVEVAREDIEQFDKKSANTIHFGVPPLIESYLFPDLFTKFITAYPGFKLDIQEYDDSTEIQRRIQSGELDFGIVLGDDVPERAGEMLIMKDSMSLCLYHGHPLEQLNAVDVFKLKNSKFIMQKEYNYQYKSVFRCCQRNGFIPQVAYTFKPIKTIKEFIIKREGISILPGFVIQNDKKLVKKPIIPAINFHVMLVWRPSRILSGMDNMLLNFVKQYISTAEFRTSFLNK